MHCPIRILFCFIAALLTCGSLLRAEPIRQPPALEPGDQYRIIFVTSETRDATSTEIQEYNDFVQAVADSAPVVGSWDVEWKAVVSTETISARENVTDTLGIPIFRIDGTPYAPEELFFGQNGRVEFTELGTTLPQNTDFEDVRGAAVWTGGEGEFVPTIGFMGDDRVTIGGSMGGGVVAYGLSGADFKQNEHHLYAVSEILIAVPEPTASHCLFVIVVAIMHCVRSRRRERLT